jgi:hypothetical protein
MGVSVCVFVEVSVVKTCLASLDQAGHLIAEAVIFNFCHEHQIRMCKLPVYTD